MFNGHFLIISSSISPVLFILCFVEKKILSISILGILFVFADTICRCRYRYNDIEVKCIITILMNKKGCHFLKNISTHKRTMLTYRNYVFNHNELAFIKKQILSRVRGTIFIFDLSLLCRLIRSKPERGYR